MEKIEGFLEDFSKYLISQNYLQIDEVELHNKFNQYISKFKCVSPNIYKKLNCNKNKHHEHLLQLYKRNRQHKLISLIYRITKGAEIELQNAKKILLSSCRKSQDCSNLLQLLVHQPPDVLPELMYFILEVLEKKVELIESENLKEYNSQKLLDILTSLWSKLQMIQKEKNESCAEVYRALFSIYMETSLKFNKKGDSLIDIANLMFDSNKHSLLDVFSVLEIDEFLISDPDTKRIFEKMYITVVKNNWINADFDDYLKLVTILKKAQDFLDQKSVDVIKSSVEKIKLNFCEVKLCYKSSSGKKLLIKYESKKEFFSTFILENAKREEIDDLLYFYNKEDDSSQQVLAKSDDIITEEEKEANFDIDIPEKEDDPQLDEECDESDSDDDLSDDVEMISDDDESVALNKSVDELKDLDEAFIDKIDSSDNEDMVENKVDNLQQMEVSKNSFKNSLVDLSDPKPNTSSIIEENLENPVIEKNLPNVLNKKEILNDAFEVKTNSSSEKHGNDESSFIKTRVSGLIKENDPEIDFEDFMHTLQDEEKEKVEEKIPCTPPKKTVVSNCQLRTPKSARKPETPTRSSRRKLHSTQILRRSTRIRKPTTKS